MITPNYLQFPSGMTEQKFKEQVALTSKLMRAKLSTDEQMKVAFVPLVIQHIIFTYAGNFTRYCADKRLSQYKRECREIKQLYADLLYDMKKDLDSVHIKKIVTETEAFTYNCHKDLMILHFCVNAEVKKKYPDCDADLFTHAFITLVLIWYLSQYIKKMNELVRQRLGTEDDAYLHPCVHRLMEVVQSVTKGKDIDCGGHIDTCLKIVDNQINKMEFSES